MYTQSLIQFFIIHIISSYCDDYSTERDDYVSLESGEQSEINKVSNIGTEDYIDKDYFYVENNNTKYDRKQNSATNHDKPKVLVKVNTTSPYECGELKKKSDSIEENRCKMSLVNYPYSVSIQKKGAHYTSGALIDTQTVLTVAGEFFNVRESIKIYKVRLGSVDCKKGGILLPIRSVDIHPSYEIGKPAYDVALLKLASPVNVTQYIKPIALSKMKQKVISAKFMTSYWPRLIVNGEILPKTAKERVKYQSMRVSTQKLIPWKNCHILIKTRGMELDANSLCLKPIATHHSVCTPDVGAPVVADDGLWGITSGWTSKQCKLYPSPTIFTRLSLKPVQSWLKELL